VTQGQTVYDLSIGAAPSLHTSERSVHRARTIHDGAEGRFLHSIPRFLLSGRTLSGRRELRVCLGVGRPPKTPLIDVEPTRGEDSS
jgi:hypothetical protein